MNLDTQNIWQAAGFSNQEMANVAQALGYQSIDDPGMPSIATLTRQQMQVIEQNVPAAAQKIGGSIQGIAEPHLPPPEKSLDASQMTMIMSLLNKELGELGIQFTKEGLQLDKEKLAQTSADRMKALQESVEKLVEAANKSKVGKIFGWIGAVAAVIGAAVATVLTGGAAAPALAIALIGLTMMILTETGQMDKIMDKLADAFIAVYDKIGMKGLAFMFGPIGLIAGAILDATVGKDWGQSMKGNKEAVKIALQVAITVALVAASFATGNPSTGSLTRIGKMLSDAAKFQQYVNNAATAAQVIAAVGEGASGISSAVTSKEAAGKQADAKEFMAWMKQLQSQIEQLTEELEEILQKLQNMAFAQPKEILDSIANTMNEVATSHMASGAV